MANGTQVREPARLKVVGPMRPGYEEILTPAALAFVEDLVLSLRDRVDAQLKARIDRQKRFDQSERPDFLPETKQIRESAWRVAPLPKDILDRRVEITGPVERKMIINALNSGASVFMADCEDANSPTWDNVVQGQINLRDAVAGTISYTAPDTGKHYRLNDKTAVLFVRPRGWHLPEKHVLLDGRPIPGGLLDFGLYFFHNVANLLKKGTGPYFYLPKMESHLEARLWNDAFIHAQKALDIPQGTIKATVLIETLPAAFEMDEILWELKEHSAGLNCGRWDYIFSFIKKFRNDPRYVMPDRGQVTMTQNFMRSYTLLLIKTCHKREVHAMGGMAAQIPIKDPAQNQVAIDKVRADKFREVTDGHDGTWVAHPGLVPVAKDIFDAHMKGPNQIARKREDVTIVASDLVAVASGTRTEAGLRQNINVGVQYIEAWLRGLGCVPLHNLMEDAATAEISRTQVWQWIRHKAKLEDGRVVTPDLFRKILAEELAGIRKSLGDQKYEAGRFGEASALFEKLSTSSEFVDFLTLPAYDLLVSPSVTKKAEA
jgi:malate synthase